MCGVSTDGAPAMLGHKSGFQVRVKSKNQSVVGSHCMLHRHALVMKNIPTILKAVLNVIKMINSTKASALNCRLFSILCEYNDSEFKTATSHPGRLLSKGKSLKRLFIMRKKLQISYK